MEKFFKVVTRFCFNQSNKIKIPRPRDPTVAESFQTKIPDQQIKILIDPKGFMSEQQKILQANQLKAKEELISEKISKQYQKQGKNGVQKEYGFKPKGPEPTRYGDWQVKGKCIDF